MTLQEFQDLLKVIQTTQAESRTIEVKQAASGSPKRIYDTISSFSNQDDGGVIVFGLDENAGFAEVGVKDAQELQKQISHQALEMEPVVRPLISIFHHNGKDFVTAEIPGIPVPDRPCFYKGKGRLKGAYIRVGDSDEQMSEYEVYSYEAFKSHKKDDSRAVERATMDDLRSENLDAYLAKLSVGKPNLSSLPKDKILQMTGLVEEGHPTLCTLLLFGIYPQAFLPQFHISATSIPGTQIGQTSLTGARFFDTERIEGTLLEMLDRALAFVERNTRKETIINERGQRTDVHEFPETAVREALLNALVHRDYSVWTERLPIDLQLFTDRLVIKNPGGLYGGMTIDQLGQKRADTRNPRIAQAMELLGATENRYSGVPTIQRLLSEAGLPEPVFEDFRDSFSVTFSRPDLGQKLAYETKSAFRDEPNLKELKLRNKEPSSILEFCRVPRSRAELRAFLGVSSALTLARRIAPLLENGSLSMTIPDKPKSKFQQFVAVDPLGNGENK